MESVPPAGYGGTERVVSYLTEELVRQGHEVTLYATGDSRTGAELIAPWPRALRTDPDVSDPNPPHACLLDQVARDASRFDLVHFHLDCLHLPLLWWIPVPHVTTLHGRLDRPETVGLWRRFPDVPVVSISDAQRAPLPDLNWRGTVYHGLPEDLRSFRAEPGDYLAFLGRFSPEKRPDRAIEIARRTGMKLKMAGKVDAADRDYFEREIEPLLERARQSADIELLGEIAGADKDRFLGEARALLFPIDWPEPFGLVMIEAMACGTPTIAWRSGSVPEVIADGVTGVVVDDLDQAVAAVERLEEIDRRACRRAFEERFSATRMVRDYLSIYERLAPGAAPYALGAVDVALPPLGGAVRSSGLFVTLDSPAVEGMPGRDGEP